MGPHKAAAAPDRHPLLITQRRGAGPFSLCLSHLCSSVEEIHLILKEEAHAVLNKAGSLTGVTLYHVNILDMEDC